MANLADIPEELRDLTKADETLEFISKLPMIYEDKVALFFLWKNDVNHQLRSTDLAILNDQS